MANDNKLIANYVVMINEIVSNKKLDQTTVVNNFNALYKDSSSNKNLLSSMLYIQDKDVKKQIIKELLTAYNLSDFVDLFLASVDFNHFSYFVDIIDYYLTSNANHSNILLLNVYTKNNLNPEQKSKLDIALEKYFKKKVITTNIIDEKIIGGIYIKSEEHLIDATIKHKLEEIFASLGGVA